MNAKLLKSVDSARVSLPEAQATVQTTLAMVDRIWPQLASRSEGAAGLHLWTLFRAWNAKPEAERAVGADARLVLDLTALNRLLDIHFREPKRRFVRVSEEGEGGQSDAPG